MSIDSDQDIANLSEVVYDKVVPFKERDNAVAFFKGLFVDWE